MQQPYRRTIEHRALQSVKAKDRGYNHSPECSCVWCGANPASTHHGDCTRQRRAPEYVAWNNMRARCFNPNHPKFKDYGGRGITVCDQWAAYETFLRDVGRRPGPDYSIDRIDNDGNYEPGNVRWATRSQQQLNQRRQVA